MKGRSHRTGSHRSGIRLSNQARDALTAAARQSRTRERGGILVGYRSPEGVHVIDALAVPDADAQHTRYVRLPALAQAVLQDFLAHSDGPLKIGYVGEWHTHPLPVGPSSTDLAAMRTMVMKGRGKVALIVASLNDDTLGVTMHGRISSGTAVERRLRGSHVESPVDFRERPH